MDTASPISNVGNYSDSPSKPRGSKKKLYIIIAIVVILVGGFLFFRNSQKAADEEQQITPTIEEEEPTERPTRRPTKEPTEEPEDEPTEEPTKKPTPADVNSATDMSIQVLNGSGEAGVANAGQSHLSGQGYEFVETGNADNFDYEGVVVRIKASRSEFTDTLVGDLKEKYDTVKTETLEDSSSVDAIVIIGK